ncbi:hypothetical protein L210DRAFT_3319027, partial [Boletus edulis BED1]
LRRQHVVPVILGQSLSRCGTDTLHDDDYYRYLLLLFKPWRSFTDLRADGSTWREAYESTRFSPQCVSLIRNMEVDAECRDAK